MSVHFSSKCMTFETPGKFFRDLDAEFHFTLDVCAMPETAKCANYFTTAAGILYESLWSGTAALDGLAQEWSGVCWMNPPYGRTIQTWIKRASDQAKRGVTTVALIPSRTDTRWWHAYIWDAERHAPRPGVEVRFVPGRLTFGDASASAPFPSAVVIFRGSNPDSLDFA